MISSYPYISFYTLLLSLADRALLHTWDTPEVQDHCRAINTQEISANQKIAYFFCTPEQVHHALNYIHTSIFRWYFVLGRSDTELLPEVFSQIISQHNVIGIASQNTRITNEPRVMNIPIGIENYGWGRIELGLENCPPGNDPFLLTNFHDLSSALSNKRRISPRLLFSYSLGTNLETRKAILYSGLKNKYTRLQMPHSHFINNSDQNYLLEYLHASIESGYIVCPPGNGIDTHRFWQTLYLGLTPIIFKDFWLECYDHIVDYGYKVIILDSVAEIASLDLCSCDYISNNNYFEGFSLVRKNNPLHVEYWSDRITRHAEKLLLTQ